MLIDGTHPEEIRVVVTDGNKLEEYDIETSTKSQLRGNIYLAKVTRVEPSLQAAFIDYGGNRHGFLAFSEIHPDYYQIPVEDREALKRDTAQFEEHAQAAQAHLDSIDDDIDPDSNGDDDDDADGEDESALAVDASDDAGDDTDGEEKSPVEATADDAPADETASSNGDQAEGSPESQESTDETEDTPEAAEAASEEGDKESGQNDKDSSASPKNRNRGNRRSNPMRRYKIQEVIKRRQILLVQVVKEERGNKGAALTTYMSLAGRYCVLMPNTSRSTGGVSRKITAAADRRRMRDLLKDLEVADGMGVIMRTAGMQRNKTEIKRDYNYLMRLWENVRDLTLKSAAPALVYAEGDLIKRTIRDLYSREIGEVLVEGEDAYTKAKKIMRMMMPSHATRVQPYRDETIPLYQRFQIEGLLESMFNPVVQLKSGGYLVINPTEALISIDVNSGRATKERNIEETAYKTNLEAASEIARQLRLRDLAGLVVIDFIDMDENRNQRAVERRLKESVKNDRARIQLGRISTFGLFEMSRQRMRPSILEASGDTCPHCDGSGHIRSTESMAVHILRTIEEEGIRDRSNEITVSVHPAIAFYILNTKRESLTGIEARYQFRVNIIGDDELVAANSKIDRVRAKPANEQRKDKPSTLPPPVSEASSESGDDAGSGAETGDSEQSRKRRPRRRRRRGGASTENAPVSAMDEATVNPSEGEADAGETPASASTDENGEERAPRRRRRGRRGGRRRRGAQTEGSTDDVSVEGAPEASTPEASSEVPPDAGETASETSSPVPEAETAATTEETEVKKPARTRRRRAPRKAAATTDPSSEKSADQSSGDTPKVEPVPASAPQPEAAAEKTPEAAAPANAEPERRGWWQRILD
jgi:ribonuclease E